MTAEALAAAVDMPVETAEKWLPAIDAAVSKYALDGTPNRLAMWLAQCAHESRRFESLRENLNYSAKALRANWPHRFETDEVAARYERKPREIAEHVYGGRYGNGPEGSGDGFNFRGAGPIEITFRNNYRACGRAIGVDLEAHPELLASSEKLGALSAGWFFSVNKLVAAADRGDVAAVTRVVNGGETDLAKRAALYARILSALEAA